MITIDWNTKIISVPKVDTTLIQPSPEIRELNINTFRLALRALEAGFDGMPYLKTHTHNTEVSLSGVTYSRIVEIINGYTITFEDDQYAVNLVGANSNIADVVNVNQVSVRSQNSAGLVSFTLSEQDKIDIKNKVWDAALVDHEVSSSFGEMVGLRLLTFTKWFGLK